MLYGAGGCSLFLGLLFTETFTVKKRSRNDLETIFSTIDDFLDDLLDNFSRTDLLNDLLDDLLELTFSSDLRPEGRQ